MVWEPLFSSHVIVRVAEIFFRVIKAVISLVLLPIVVSVEWVGRFIYRPQVASRTLDDIRKIGTAARSGPRFFRRAQLPEASSPYRPLRPPTQLDDTELYLRGFDAIFREGMGLLATNYKLGVQTLGESDQLINEFFQKNLRVDGDKLWELHEQRNWIELILDLDPTQFSYGFHIRTEFSEISRLVDESSHTKESLRDIDILIGLVDIDRLSEEDKTPFGELKKRRLSLNVARSAE
jgi:hypothetical protein